MALKEKENLLVGVIMGSFLPSPQKTELIEIVRKAAAKEREPETRGDQLRAATDEELAEIRTRYNDYRGEYETDVGLFESYEDAFSAELNWLREPAEEETK